jgi:hypothetical protein
MTLHRWRWLLAAAIALAGLLVPACSDSQAPQQPAAKPKAPAPRSERPGGLAAAPLPAPAAAPGPARRHPFAPLDGASARRAVVATRTGPLALKGTYVADDVPTAIIQEGTATHFVTEGDQIGSMRVLTIRSGEVVLGAGHQRRVLSLYAGSDESGS